MLGSIERRAVNLNGKPSLPLELRIQGGIQTGRLAVGGFRNGYILLSNTLVAYVLLTI